MSEIPKGYDRGALNSWHFDGRDARTASTAIQGVDSRQMDFS
ncbi:hypothetical protein [Romeriopsis navalis]|nr:hypothetical protein [Romeriopsis navalis]